MLPTTMIMAPCTCFTCYARRIAAGPWSAELRTIRNALNPALAINNAGKVGFLYQQLTGTGAAQRWVTKNRTVSERNELERTRCGDGGG